MSAVIPPAEQLSLTLQELYRSYGYRQFKLSRFEEYDLYARYKSFLTSPQILTFTDQNGQLMALKPDVTLSIVRNTRPDGRTHKVWYTENVYRVPRNGSGFQEIMQTGLELIGQVDLYAMGEVLMLAARSLEAIGGSYVLELSHTGILTGVLDTLSLSPAAAADILAAMGEKNAHGLAAVCVREGLDDAARDLLAALCRLAGPAEDTLAALDKVAAEANYSRNELINLILAHGLENLEIH